MKAEEKKKKEELKAEEKKKKDEKKSTQENKVWHTLQLFQQISTSLSFT